MDDSDGYALSGEELRAVIMDIYEREIRPVLLKIYEDDRTMLKDSESRIDRTNEMIARLVEACKSVELAYTTHVGSLQSSRDTSQRNNARLITANERMTRMLEAERVASADELARLKDSFASEIREMQSRIDSLEQDKASLREELHKATDRYWELQGSYQRLAEGMNRKGATPKAEVRITG